MEEENKQLKIKVKTLQDEIEELKVHLKKYTNPKSYKTYYEKNKEKIIKQQIEYQKNKKKN